MRAYVSASGWWWSSEIELCEGDAEGLKGVDGGAVVQVEPVFSHLVVVVVVTVTQKKRASIVCSFSLVAQLNE